MCWKIKANIRHMRSNLPFYVVIYTHELPLYTTVEYDIKDQMYANNKLHYSMDYNNNHVYSDRNTARLIAGQLETNFLQYTINRRNTQKLFIKNMLTNKFS